MAVIYLNSHIFLKFVVIWCFQYYINYKISMLFLTSTVIDVFVNANLNIRVFFRIKKLFYCMLVSLNSSREATLNLLFFVSCYSLLD